MDAGVSVAFNNVLSALLCYWDERALAGLMDTLRCTFEMLRGDDQSCTTSWVSDHETRIPVVGVGGHSLKYYPVVAALGLLEEHLRSSAAAAPMHRILPETPDMVAWRRHTLEAARVWAFVLFIKDGRVRRLFMCPHRIHRDVWRTRAPTTQEFRRFMDQGAHDTVHQFLDHVARPHDSHQISPAGVMQHTEGFLTCIASWWVTKQPPPRPLAEQS